MRVRLYTEEPYEWNSSSTELWGGRRVTDAFTRNLIRWAGALLSSDAKRWVFLIKKTRYGEKVKIFISHSFEDTPKFEEFSEILTQQNISFFQPSDMSPGRSLAEQLKNAIFSCDICIFVATHNSVKSSWCGAELGAFWGAGKTVIIYLADSSLAEAQLPKQFQGHLLERNMLRAIKAAKKHVDNSQSHFLSDSYISIKARRDFPRPDTLMNAASQQLYLIGINLELVNASMPTLLELMRKEVELRLLCLDPGGAVLDAFSKFSGVSAEERKAKISANIKKLCSQLPKIGTAKWELRTIDSFLSAGYIGIDIENHCGSIIAQNYLFNTKPDHAPTITLNRGIDTFWFSVYRESIESMWHTGRVIANS